LANRQLFPETDTKSELRPTQQLLPTIGTASAVQRERRSWKSEVTRLNAVIAQLEAQLAQRMLDASYLAVLRESDRDSNIAKENLLNQQAERQFSSLLEIAPDAMVIADFDGTIVLVNSHAEVLFGYCRQELIGMKLDDLMPTECRASQDAYLSEFLSSAPSKTISPSAELWGLRKDASEFPFEVSLSPLNTLAGALTIGAFRDLTERRETDRLVLRAQRLESIGTFAGNIAHDLNNALAPILMSLELLRLQNPDCRDLIATIEAGANRGVEMLRQLLVFSKGSFVEFKPVHPQDTIDLRRQFEQEWLPGDVVQPVDTGEVAPTSAVLPIVFQELRFGHGKLPLEVSGQAFDDADIAAELVPRLKNLEHQHLAPEVAEPQFVVVHGPEIAVRPLRSHRALDPEPGLLDHRGVVQDVTDARVASQPIRQFFPTVLPLSILAEPGIALLR